MAVGTSIPVRYADRAAAATAIANGRASSTIFTGGATVESGPRDNAAGCFCDRRCNRGANPRHRWNEDHVCRDTRDCPERGRPCVGRGLTPCDHRKNHRAADEPD